MRSSSYSDRKADRMEFELLQQESFSGSSDTSNNPVRARILYPALGCPAVIAPRSGAGNENSDASHCICLLLLSNRKFLSKAEAARYLRYAPWNERDRRHIAQGKPGSFDETDLSIRNDSNNQQLTMPGWKDQHGAGFFFGGDRDGNRSVVVKLADYVRNFYRKAGLEYLHEIRVSEARSAQLQDGLYQIFWNSEGPGDDKPSSENAELINRFAPPRRQGLNGLWESQGRFLKGEYEFEYGSLQQPYMSPMQMRPKRMEILHPLFVRKEKTDRLPIAQITDLHVNVRANVYEVNLKNAKANIDYNNWNKSFVKGYEQAKKSSKIILLTGDLIDFGRGHWGLTATDKLGDDRLYHVDRNWFLLYYLLASGDSYQQPVFTILGNHDWRLNPYPPFAIAGAPDPKNYFHNHQNFSKADLEQFLKTAHGPGHERKFTYFLSSDGEFMKKFWESGGAVKTVLKIFANRKTLDEPHLPVETTVESVAWYLLAINPFLDYYFTLPQGQQLLMLDWAEDEDLFFPIYRNGESWPFLPWQIKQAAQPGPKARNCLTSLQKKMLESFCSARGSAKLIGIHAPPIGPYPDWYDYPDLFTGKKIYESKTETRGPGNYGTKRPDGSVERWNGHPLFAIEPTTDGKNKGTVADYGSFQQGRNWFLQKVSAPNSGVKLVLAGHIHRNGLYTVRIGQQKEGAALAGKMLLRSYLVASEGVPKDYMKRSIHSFQTLKSGFPLFVNTTSAGPRGDFYASKIKAPDMPKGGLSMDPGIALIDWQNSGLIDKVEFRSSLM